MQQMSNEQYKAKAVSSFQWLYPLLIALFVATLIKLATSKYMAFEWKNTYDWLHETPLIAMKSQSILFLIVSLLVSYFIQMLFSEGY
jgi:cellobiose-specific phosphotransferase system component IIC